MQWFSLTLSVLTVLHSVFAVPTTLHTIEKYAGETTGRHVIQLKPGFDKARLVQQMKKAGNVTHEWDIVNGFAGHFDDDTLNVLRADPNVELISEDGIVHTTSTQ
jgi:cerevisin